MQHIKKYLILTLFIVFGLILTSCNTEGLNKYDLKKVSNAYITIDINPSIEIITGEDGLVKQVNALNEDAIKLLIDTNFASKTVDEVLDAILQLAIEYGYIDFALENAVLITVASENKTEELEDKISKKVLDFVEDRQIKIKVLKASLEASEEIKALAAEYGISVGKVKLITYTLMIDTELAFADAAKYSIRDLNKIIQKDRDEVREFYSKNIRDEYQNAKDLLKKDLRLQVIELLNKEIQEANVEDLNEFIKDSNITVDQIKTLYQEYYEKVVDEVWEEEVEEDTNVDIDEETLVELKKQYEDLEKQIQELKIHIKGKKLRELENEEIEAILTQIKELMLAQREILLQINEINTPNDKEHARFGFKFDFVKYLGGKSLFDPKDGLRVVDSINKIKKVYEEKFLELGINLEELEEFFMDKITNEIKELKVKMQTQLDSIREVFINDSKAIREQIREENKILKDIWKKR
jgi:hypothetical protein